MSDVRIGQAQHVNGFEAGVVRNLAGSIHGDGLARIVLSQKEPEGHPTVAFLEGIAVLQGDAHVGGLGRNQDDGQDDENDAVPSPPRRSSRA